MLVQIDDESLMALLNERAELNSKVAALELAVKNLTASNTQRDEIKPCSLSKWCIAYAVNQCSLHLCRKFITA